MARLVNLDKLPLFAADVDADAFVRIRDVRRALRQAELETRKEPPKKYYDTLVCAAVRSYPWVFVDMLNGLAHGPMPDPNEDIRPLIAEAACVIANLLTLTGGVVEN